MGAGIQVRGLGNTRVPSFWRYGHLGGVERVLSRLVENPLLAYELERLGWESVKRGSSKKVFAGAGCPPYYHWAAVGAGY